MEGPAQAKSENDEKAAAPEGDTPPEMMAVEQLEKRIRELEEQVKEKENKYIYLYAEFENYKKRALKERGDLIKFGWEPVAQELLQVIDNLERAFAHMPANTDQVLIDGLKMVLNQFKATLEKNGVQKVESIEKAFDPNLHEAVGQESSDLSQGLVVKEHTSGYTLHGRLLRPARVIISSGKAS